MKYTIIILASIIMSCNNQNVTGQSIVDSIVLVNTGTASRDKIARLINKINQLKPRVVSVDFQFSNEGSPSEDNNLAGALDQCKNLVMVSVIDNYSADKLFQESFKQGDGCLPKFTRNAKTGFANLIVNDEFKTLNKFSLLEYVNGKAELSFAMRTAFQFDSVKAIRYQLTNKNYNEIVFHGGLNNFRRLSIESFLTDNLSKDIVQDKIVMIGFLGPGDGDKFFADFDNTKLKEPNIYGLEFHAQVIAQILR